MNPTHGSTILVVVGCLTLALAACKSDPQPSAAAIESAALAALSTKPAPAPAAPAAPVAKPASASAPAPAVEDVGELSVQLFEKMADLFVAHRADCNALGNELQKLITDSRDAFVRVKKAGEKQTRKQKKAFERKYKTRLERSMAKMEPAIKACRRSKKVQSAMRSLPI